jgi:subtilisin family serine protease
LRYSVRFSILSTGLVSLLLPTACGGGGSSTQSSALPPGRTPTPAASSTPSTHYLTDCARATSTQATAKKLLSVPSGAVTAVPNTVYTLTSFPGGARVTNNGSSLGATPVTFTPTYTDAANAIKFASGSSTFTMCLAQMGFSSRTILFNAAGDTSGSIGTISTSSYLHKASFARQGALPLNLIRHALRHAPAESASSALLFVKYRATRLQSSKSTVGSIEEKHGIRSSWTLGPASGTLITRVARVPEGTSAEKLASALTSESMVASVDRVHRRSTLSIVPVMPNDPDFTQNDTRQWDLYEIQAPYAWGISEGSPSVAIAVIDTGYDPGNQDLARKVTFSESLINGVTTVGSAAAQDTDGHGTNVSGIAAAATNNGIGAAGTGFNVSLQEYRIFSNPGDPGYIAGGNATTVDESQAIYDAIAHGAKVISLSIGGTESGGIDQGEYDAVEYAISKGVTVVSASGNERANGVNTVDFPGAYPGVIAVGASALNDSSAVNVRGSATEYVAPYSNAGPGLTLVAPGGDPNLAGDNDNLHWILNLDTTKPASGAPCASASDCVAFYAGTSQATPHVAGTAALMYSLKPELTPAQVTSILMANADNINDPRQGAGRLNMYRTLAAVAGVPAPTAPAPANFVAFAYTNSGGTTPTIIDRTFTSGVPLDATGTFRLPDIDPSAGSYRIGLWADTNGDGVIDAGDSFGAGSGLCRPTAPCAGASGIAVAPVGAGFTLP